MDLRGPNGIMAARRVFSFSPSARPPTYSVRRDWIIGAADDDVADDIIADEDMGVECGRGWVVDVNVNSGAS